MVLNFFENHTNSSLWKIRAGNLLNRSSLIHSFTHFAQIKWATVSDLLRLLKKNERPWVNRSGGSEEMSDVSDSLRSLRGNEQCEWIAHFAHQKWANERFDPKIWLKRSKILFYYVLFKVFYKKNFEKMSESLIFAHFLFFGEWCEWIAHFAQIKWAMWVNRSFHSPKMSDHERFTQRKWAILSKSLILLTKKEQMSESLIFLEWIAH